MSVNVRIVVAVAALLAAFHSAVAVGEPRTQAVASFACLNVDGTGSAEVATDVTYIARHMLGLPPVPASFRAQDPSIASDVSIAAAIDAICTPAPSGHGLPASGQTTSYGPGSDGDIKAGATLSYRDNGDGTITDNNTGLMWEKKDDAGGIHDKDNNYTWGMNSSPYTMNGSMVTSFLATLNAGAGFAGHTDWRIPNVKELQSIVDYEVPYPGPTVNVLFNSGCSPGCTISTCSCTVSGCYWSSTTYRLAPVYAWGVYFNFGLVDDTDKSYNYYVRAVRGGL